MNMAEFMTSIAICVIVGWAVWMSLVEHKKWKAEEEAQAEADRETRRRIRELNRNGAFDRNDIY